MEKPDFNYGSDPSGLVWGYLFGQGLQAVQIDSGAALAWLQTAESEREGQFIWLHFNLSNTASEKWLTAHANLAEEFYETLHLGSRSTRIELAENTLIAVVNDVLHNFSLDSADIATLWLSVAQGVVISARRTPSTTREMMKLR